MTITAEQKAMRVRGIGGSDAPVIAGASPWKTPVALYFEKIGEAEPVEATLPMKVGTALEPLILREWSRMMGREVHAITDTLHDHIDPRLFGHVDGCVTGALEGVEAKWVGNPSDEWGDVGTDSVPSYVFIQCTHYLMITGWTRWHVAAALGGREVRPYTIERDERIINKLRDMELNFLGMIERREPPPMMRASDVRALYPQASNELFIVADEETRAIVERLRLISRERKDLEIIEEQLTAKIQEFMGEAGELRTIAGLPIATWKSTKPIVRLDAQRLKQEQPAWWSAYAKEGATERRFLIRKERDNDR